MSSVNHEENCGCEEKSGCCEDEKCCSEESVSENSDTGFTRDSKLSEAVARENGVLILVKHGVPCPTCPMAMTEMDILTLGMICDTYGLDGDALLADLNA